MRRSNWNEVLIQFLDGTGQDHMTVVKFSGILKKVTTTLDGLRAAALKIEFSSGNNGLRILDPGNPVATGNAVSLPLSDINAACSPAVDAALMHGADGCCGSSPQAGQRCC